MPRESSHIEIRRWVLRSNISLRAFMPQGHLRAKLMLDQFPTYAGTDKYSISGQSSGTAESSVIVLEVKDSRRSLGIFSHPRKSAAGLVKGLDIS